MVVCGSIILKFQENSRKFKKFWINIHSTYGTYVILTYTYIAMITITVLVLVPFALKWKLFIPMYGGVHGGTDTVQGTNLCILWDLLHYTRTSWQNLSSLWTLMSTSDLFLQRLVTLGNIDYFFRKKNLVTNKNLIVDMCTYVGWDIYTTSLILLLLS